jgi:hypothetical protein
MAVAAGGHTNDITANTTVAAIRVFISAHSLVDYLMVNLVGLMVTGRIPVLLAVRM